ncbi:hypothetical protein BH23CHL8_BH23CHL8_30050 [soil metagenome]
MTHLAWSEAIGKRVRAGDWADQAVPTLTKAREALAEAGDEFGLKAGRREVAAQLVDYFMEEAKVVYVIYDVWTKGFLEWLAAKGVSEAELSAELDRLDRLMAYPDGTPLDPAARWDALGEKAGRLGNRIRAYRISVADADIELDELNEGWRQLHDRYADVMAGVLAFVAQRFGEAALEDCYRAVLEPYIQERYMPFDTRMNPYESTLPRNLYTVFEAMRAHLVGPARDGTIELEEHDDRVVVRFDPCGSGGRSMRGDPIEGTGSRVLEPYEFGVTKGKHDWAWNQEGVCYYCAHCCLTLEKLPAERWGHPVRVVEPPIWGGSTEADSTQRKCTWTVYKSLEAIPEEAYRRIGHTKPQLPVIQPGAPTRDVAPDGVADAGSGEQWLGPRD